MSLAQTDSLPVADSLIKTDSIPKKWKLKAIYGLNGTQTSFVNWNAGGRNNVSLLGSISASANYEKKTLKWTNDFSLALGGLQYIEKGSKEGMQKTDDRIDIASNLGYKLKEHFYFSVIGGFKTQMLDGFTYPNDSIRVSTFLAPGYVSSALGIDYIKSDNFSIFTSPFAMKLTIVNDQVLANAGSFGVTAATYDGLGNVLKQGERLRGEFGAYVKMKYNFTIAKNIDLKSKLELFSNYLNNPQNIDVNAEALFNFKVNEWFSASLQWTLIYDDDIDIRDADGNIGPRTQFKSVLGLGISYKMMNFKD
ncbi:MAG: hypothetical protein RI922_2620 [Bacteroidota bacterium]|jgi:hypothetical protein